MNNIVAYAGIECFDLILYQARILSKMGRKVLILENRDSGAFYCTIPRPSGMDALISPVTYRHVDFAVMALSEKLIEHYDDIFISYGFYVPEESYNKIIFATDLMLHNMETVRELYAQNDCTNKSILIRNVIDVDVDPDNLFGQLGDVEIDYLNFDERDLSIAIRCQHYQSMKFDKLSREARKYLEKEIKQLYPAIETKVIHKAYHDAKRGN